MAPSIQELRIAGIRNFLKEQSLQPACPVSSKPGSGLTMLVGPNNGGKSTVLEVAQAASRGHDLPVSRSMRNSATDYRASVALTFSDGQQIVLESDLNDPQILKVRERDQQTSRQIPLVGLTRILPEHIELQPHTREEYLNGQPNALDRKGAINLVHRVTGWRNSSGRFKVLADRVLDFPLKYYNEGRQWYVKVSGHEHDPAGLGSGIASILHVIDALHDAKDGSTVLIDEPELALHPAYQRRLHRLLMDESQRVQIIYTTHSPHMVDWTAILNGAKLCRIVSPMNEEGSAKICELSTEAATGVACLNQNLRNPHILGTVAREIFFLNDGVILTEGQDDVVMYRAMAQQLGVNLSGDFYGWGAGGAENMPKILRVLADLGFQRVVSIVDRNKKAMQSELQAISGYRCLVIPTDDVRDKEMTKGAVRGLCDTRGLIHEDQVDAVRRVFTEIELALTQRT